MTGSPAVSEHGAGSEEQKLAPFSMRVVILVCAAVILLLWVLQLNPYLNVANDSGRYMVLGELIARLGQLRLVNLPRPLPDTLYPPGFPAIIAFWLLVTGRGAGGVVLPVKATLVTLLILVLPLFTRLFRFANLPRWWTAAGMVLVALCPALIAYANDVMSEIPFLVMCLISIALVERDTRAGQNQRHVPGWVRAVSLASAACAYLIRTAAIALLLVQIVWFWKRYGPRWGAIALIAALTVVGGWQIRTHRIIAHAPPDVHYDTYFRQFSLKDPMDPGAGRIQLNAKGVALRLKMGVPSYIGMLPRALMNSMSIHTPWFWVFYVCAVPLCCLIVAGFVLAVRRGLWLSTGFSGLFWLMTALWPWRSPRFLVPLIPYLITFALIAAHELCTAADRRVGGRLARAAVGAGGALLVCYFLHVEAAARHDENAPAVPGYALGRNLPEGGFYAACDWLRANAVPGSVTMGRPAYLLHLYSGLPTTQIEPTARPRAQELAYMKPEHVRYLVQDQWPWSNTTRFIVPYLRQYGEFWKLDFKDARSGVCVWERVAVPPHAGGA